MCGEHGRLSFNMFMAQDCPNENRAKYEKGKILITKGFEFVCNELSIITH